MNKWLLFFCVFVVMTVTSLDAQWRCGDRRFNWCCRRYVDYTEANYDCIPYGYVDNINYPDTYRLPINRCFNYCPPCPCDSYNKHYFDNCCRYTRARWGLFR